MSNLTDKDIQTLAQILSRALEHRTNTVKISMNDLLNRDTSKRKKDIYIEAQSLCERIQKIRLECWTRNCSLGMPITSSYLIDKRAEEITFRVNEHFLYIFLAVVNGSVRKRHLRMFIVDPHEEDMRKLAMYLAYKSI